MAMEALPGRSVAGQYLDGPDPTGARKRRRCSTPDAPATPAGSIHSDHPEHSPPAASWRGGGCASAALEVPPQVAPLFPQAPRPGWPNDPQSRYRQAVVVCTPTLIAALVMGPHATFTSAAGWLESAIDSQEQGQRAWGA